MGLEIRHLRALRAIASAGSLSRAAAELGMSQPSLTSLLQRIEARVGSRLFVRDHTGVAPTASGEQLLRRALVALAEFDLLESELGRSTAGSRLRVGVSRMACTERLLCGLDDRLSGLDPLFSVDSSTAALAQAFSHRFHDLSVVMLSDDSAAELPPELSTRVVFATLPVFVALAADHPLASEEEIDLRDLAAEFWIGPPGADDGSLAELRAVCGAAGFEPRVRFMFPQGGGRGLISAGRAVQLVDPASTELPGLVTRPLRGVPVRLRLVLAWHRDRAQWATVEQCHRVTVDSYSAQARESKSYAAWWRRHRLSDPWVRQLDQVFQP
ncbi:LysR family transcriptional regulator [Arthrobacter sp. NPDC090010]|uniref:LysR family transcriptional regulator n=1 Tax=Arthrobacter sp. NPDC090010 TaxID=3363942 RepID=UPI0037F7AB6C